jgi:predicted GIY-YIG superfamily endonuclease
MSIDNCQDSFEELAKVRLPQLMKEMNEAMKNPIQMSFFSQKGTGLHTILKHINKPKDFRGCYVLLDNNGPIYVGISRKIIQRLIQHVKGTTHYDASLAYRMASDENPHTKTREKAMGGTNFQTAFNKKKEYISTLSVSFIKIKDDIELYLFEVYCSMKLDTSKWNTFKTH